MSRPSKINPDMITRIADRIRVGNTPVTSALSVGIRKATFFRWMAIGNGHAAAGTHSLYREFRDQVEKAKAEAIVTLVAIVRDAAPKSPTVAIRMLEAADPEVWSPRSHMSIKEEGKTDDAPFTIALIAKDREDAPAQGVENAPTQPESTVVV